MNASPLHARGPQWIAALKKANANFIPFAHGPESAERARRVPKLLRRSNVRGAKSQSQKASLSESWRKSWTCAQKIF
jgi:hypothetical protein